MKPFQVLLAVRRRVQKKKQQYPRVEELMFFVQIFASLIVISFVFAMSILPARTSQVQSAVLTLYVGSQERVFTGEVIPGMTVLDALSTSFIAGNIPFRFSVHDGSTEILSFGGITANLSNRITFFLNAEEINPAKIHEVPISADDRIVVRLKLGAK